jgi:hypothetical protein
VPLYTPVGRNLISLLGSSTEFLEPPPLEHNSFNFDWSWLELDDAPFTRAQVTSYSAHPDGRTLFVSTRNKSSLATTYTLDTEDGVWTKRGEWKLPFRGHAHFDAALDARVGLPRGKGTRRGHLCSCAMVPIHVEPSNTTCDMESTPADSNINSFPTWKLGADKMFCVDPAEEHLGVALVYMGGRSKYCLLQCFSAPDEDDMDNDADKDDPYKEDVGEENLPCRHMLRFTTFTLKYDKDGDLSTSRRQRVRCYELPPRVDPTYNDLRAFMI